MKNKENKTENTYYYIGANPTVDLVILNHKNELLLIKRSANVQACPDMWALPGGFVDTESKKGDVFKIGSESYSEAAFRELEEETGLTLSGEIGFVGVFEGNQRDPRDNKVSWSQAHAFSYRMTEEEFNIAKPVEGLDDAQDAEWIPIEEVKEMHLAFDHSKIIHQALEKILSSKADNGQKRLKIK